ncbi:hypothetical protein [Lysobacter terrae]
MSKGKLDAQAKSALKQAEFRDFIDNGYKWMRNWPAFLRWLLILPAALLLAASVRSIEGVMVDHALQLPDSGIGWRCIGANFVVQICVTFVFIATAAGTAPNYRKWVAAIAFTMVFGLQILIDVQVASDKVAMPNGWLDCIATGLGTLLGGMWILWEYWRAASKVTSAAIA